MRATRSGARCGPPLAGRAHGQCVGRDAQRLSAQVRERRVGGSFHRRFRDCGPIHLRRRFGRLQLRTRQAHSVGRAGAHFGECYHSGRSDDVRGSLQTGIFLPGFAAENGLAAVPKSVDPRIWIGNRSDISCHNDTFDNIACVVSGRRRFTLYPPDAVADLYVGPLDYTMSGRPISLAAGAPANDPRYPRFAAAAVRATWVELAPGDALYLPKLWWHRVEATDSFNVLVNYWWDEFSAGPDAPYTAMMLAMIAIAERPAEERAAWRAFFDHYVFRPRGHPLAHLPEDKHGVLGPLAAGNYGRIRAMVMQLLRGG